MTTKRGRPRTGFTCGHPNEGEHVYISPRGVRNCRICRSAKAAATYKQMPKTFKCGHPNSAENTYIFKDAKRPALRTACHICRSKRAAANNKKYVAKVKPKTPKWKGIPAGRITIPQYKF